MSPNFGLAAHYLVDLILTLFAGILLLRFLLQVVRANFYNPLSQLVVRITNPVLVPLRRVIPGVRGYDLACVILVYVAVLLDVVVLTLLFSNYTIASPWLLWWALIKALRILIGLYFMTVIIAALASWLGPAAQYNPVIGVLGEINRPLLRPVRRLMPQDLPIDFSPLIVLVGLQVLRILLPPLPGFL